MELTRIRYCTGTTIDGMINSGIPIIERQMLMRDRVMNVFHTHSRIVEDYKTYICSFLNIADISKGLSLYQHQVEAIRLGTAGKDFIVTSGT